MFKKIVGVVTGLCLVALITMGAYSTFSSLRLQLKADDTFAIQVRDTSGVTRFRVDITGAPHVYNSSGTEVWGVDALGQPTKVSHTVVNLSGTSYYNVNKANGSEFWIDDLYSTLGTRVASGVSIMLPKITSAYNNYTVKIQKMTSIAGISSTAGVTAFSGSTVICVSTVPWVSGTTDQIWNVTTGVTNESSTKVSPEVKEIDAVGDYLVFKAVYGASGSTWYQVGRYIQ
uniref:Uncharacterized protein n=1 Tax=viral metagenome TaxID=1070528 RepID=A0A6M3J0E8_9ZZZZ